MEFVRTRSGDELDLYGAFASGIRTGRSSADGDLFDGIEPRADIRIEAVGGLALVVLDVDAVHGDVDRALGEAVDGGGARRPGCDDSGKAKREIERFARD
jgi:hypothetical protein